MYKDVEKVFVYGAGRYAEAVYNYLYVLDKKSAIQCFIVTEKQEKNSFHGIPIQTFEMIKDEIKDETIWIAVKDADAIEEELKHAGIKKIERIKLDDIIQMGREIKEILIHKPIIPNRIIFECFEDKGYECNCKYIAQKLIDLKLPVEIIWSVAPESNYSFPKEIKTLQADYSMNYLRTYSSAGVIISNMRTPNEYKNEKTYFINTWHGTGPFKKVGASAEINRKKKDWCQYAKKMYNKTDLYISNSADNTYMIKASFMYDGEIMESGNPRNDVLFHSDGIKGKVCKVLGISSDKKLVLYAPTYRENREKSFSIYDLDMEKVLESLQYRFKEEYVLLYRFHHYLRSYKEFDQFYPIGINVTDYPDIMELVVATDILITDYSSTMWDFSLQRRPVFLYQNDENSYVNGDRDFYWPVSRWPYIKAQTTDEMCEKIMHFDEEAYLKDLEQFFTDDPSYDDGNATDRVIERIMDVINHPERYGKA